MNIDRYKELVELANQSSSALKAASDLSRLKESFDEAYALSPYGAVLGNCDSNCNPLSLYSKDKSLSKIVNAVNSGNKSNLECTAVFLGKPANITAKRMEHTIVIGVKWIK